MLIRAIKEAWTDLVDLEDLSDAELQRLQEQFRQLHERGLGHQLPDSGEEPRQQADQTWQEPEKE